LFSLDYKDSRPLYEQISEQISDFAARGILAADTQLPSVRQLALELSINPNTIQRAYADLERAGVVYSLKGKGNFISSDLSRIREQKKQSIVSQLLKPCRDAFLLGFPGELLKNKIDEYYEAFQRGDFDDRK
jgi:GntR family transcriptional regulator